MTADILVAILFGFALFFTVVAIAMLWVSYRIRGNVDWATAFVLAAICAFATALWCGYEAIQTFKAAQNNKIAKKSFGCT